ncbi:267_t:CDS:2 [Diversispora eburnea]|uniref:Carboxypeptidase n=1 Tax=Diversispora eburnea TaxID=1213867 RepID=A0A9N8VMU3_9GLOM|nr:267_t:CDS:2 [Diversispora eburnea]
MIGLFQELGPCQSVQNTSKVCDRPESWNKVSNLLFVDQPIGAGFSYGDRLLSTTEEAAEVLYEFLQLWFNRFPEYSRLDFHLFGESYAGHYVPATADLILKNNNLKKKKKSDNIISINLKSIGIGNGLISPAIQYESMTHYCEHSNYGHILSPDLISKMKSNFPTCKKLINKCAETNSPDDCGKAGDYCGMNYYSYFLDNSGLNPYDVRYPNTTIHTHPSPDYINYLSDPDVLKKIGAKIEYTECSEKANYPFIMEKADDMRDFLPVLSSVVNQGIRTLLFFGDADFGCNWMGGHNVSKAIQWKNQKQFNCAPFKEWCLGESKPKGKIQTYCDLTFISVYEAGHEVPFYQPKASLEMFRRWINKEVIN